MDDLVEQLNKLRIARQEATRDYQLAIDENIRQERSVLADNRRHQQRQTTFQANLQNN